MLKMTLVAIETELPGAPTLLSLLLKPRQVCRRPVRKGGAKAAATWIYPSGSSFSAAALHNKYTRTLELLQLLLSMRHPKGTCWLLPIQSHYY